MGDNVNQFKEKILNYLKENKTIVRRAVIVLAVIFLAVHIRGCLQRSKKTEENTRPVRTAISFSETVPVYVTSFGTLSSPENVDIKAQVTGKITEVKFTQGQEVAKGQLLFVVDDAPYKAELDKAEAALQKDRAQLKLDMDTLERNKPLMEKGLISQQDYETLKTDVASLKAQIELDKADIETARINVGYCQIRSPINGITGKRQVDVGNIISANTGPVLVNVKKLDKLYLDFTLPEKYLQDVRNAMEHNELDVKIIVPEDGKKTFSGKLEFIDNAVNDATGTFSLRAIVDNTNRALWPGQFVNLHLILGEEKDAVLVPYDAVQIGKKGYYLFVITDDNKADLREVEAGSRQGENIVIKRGVNAGEKIVTFGQMGLSPGVPVIDITGKADAKQKESAG